MDTIPETRTIQSYTTSEPRVRVYDLRAYLERAGHRAQVTHRHRFWQIIVFRESEGVHEVDLVPHPYVDGSIVTLAPGAVHRFETADVDGHLIHFRHDHVARGAPDGEFLLYLRALAVSAPISTPEGDERNACERTIAALDEEQRRADRDAELEQALVIVLLRQIRRQRGDAAQVDKRYTRFLAAIETGYAEHRSIGEYATALGMSERALYALTRSAVGRSPGQVLTERLILEARRLLAYSDEQIAQIAFALGYEDPAYFGRVFRKHIGMAPSRYRANLRSPRA